MRATQTTIGTQWVRIVKVCAGVALLSLVFDISLTSELSGRLQSYSFVRKTIAKVFNSGTLWAAVAVYAGWVMGRARLGLAIIAGVAAAEGALLLHYGLGMVLGIHPENALSANIQWFLAGVLFCGPLGACGWTAARPDRIGLAARLFLPVAAIVEPFVTSKFRHPFPGIPWSEKYSDISSGVLLVLIGVASALIVLKRDRERSARSHEPRITSDRCS